MIESGEARFEGFEGGTAGGDERVRSAREILEEKLARGKNEMPQAEQALKAAAERAPSSGAAGAAPAGGASGAGAGGGDLQKRIADLEKERDAARNDALVARADLDNYQKRIRREMDDVRAYAAQTVLADLLSALDNIDFTISAANLKPDFDALKLGAEMTRTQIEKVLADRGAVRVPTDNVPFDARKHEAVLSEERSDVPPNTVIQELRRGYALKDRVIRAAQVKVSRAPSGGAGA